MEHRLCTMRARLPLLPSCLLPKASGNIGRPIQRRVLPVERVVGTVAVVALLLIAVVVGEG